MSLMLTVIPSSLSAAHKELEVVGDRVLDHRGKYSFDMPVGFSVSDISRPNELYLGAKEMTFTVWVDTPGATVTDELKALRYIQPEAGGEWTLVADKFVDVDGKRAGLVEGIRKLDKDRVVHEWHLVIVWGRRYIMHLIVSEAAVGDGRRILEDILGSFRIGGKYRKPR